MFPGVRSTASRRRISCRELGKADCEGWLWNKKKESSVFVTQKWQRFWFVLKGPSLYWYNSQHKRQSDGVQTISKGKKGNKENIPQSGGATSTAEKTQTGVKDDMDNLYDRIKEGGVSFIGSQQLSTMDHFRKSFTKRNKNPVINEKALRLRALKSTLKAKEAELHVINTILDDPELTSQKFKEWKVKNEDLCNEIAKLTKAKTLFQGDQPASLCSSESGMDEELPSPATDSELRVPEVDSLAGYRIERGESLVDDQPPSPGLECSPQAMISEAKPRDSLERTAHGNATDDQQVERYVSHVLVGSLIDHMVYKMCILGLIIGNSIMIACQTNPSIAETYDTVFSVFEHMVLTVFIWEILVKWYYGFYIFWKDGWNILDFLIVLSLVLGPAVQVFMSSKVLRILRVLRVIRSIRGLTALRGIAMMVQVILQSIPDMANIFLLLVIFMLVFAVFGVTLFGADVPQSFGDLATAMYSLFICITQDGWMTIYKDFQYGLQIEAEGDGLKYGAAIYFFVFLTGGAFIFANLLVAVVTTNLELAMTEYEDVTDDKGAAQASTEKPEEDLMKDLEVVHLEQVIRETTMTCRQKPHRISSLENLTIVSFEQFCVVLEAIQKNRKDYRIIRQELNGIAEEVRGILFNREQEQEVIMRNKQVPMLNENLLMNEIASGKTGDMLSTLMILEKVKQGAGKTCKETLAASYPIQGRAIAPQCAWQPQLMYFSIQSVWTAYNTGSNGPSPLEVHSLILAA
ncbi:UNVERIFIED_CONTAM: hypothetical protein FKN15_028079 [Acipenser sinensis]